MGFFESVPKMRELSRTGPRIANIVVGLKKEKLEDSHYAISKITIKLPKSRQKTKSLMKPNIIHE